MSAVDFKSIVYEYLIEKGVERVVPKFSPDNIKEATEKEVVLEIAVGDMEPRSDDGNGMSLLFLAGVGHLSSRASWRCQQANEEPPVVEHEGLRDHGAQKPQADDVLHITGVSEQVADGKHSLRFLIHTMRGKEKVIIAQGSSLVVVPSIPELSVVSTGLLAPPTPSAGNLPAPSVSSASPPPPPIPKKSSLRSAPYSILPKRRVSFGKNSEQKVFQFMFMNVSTAEPGLSTELSEVMKAIGLEPRKVSFAPLPIRTRHKFVFYFEVYDGDAAKVEELIEERRWVETFDPATMATMRKGNMAKAMSMQDIVEAMILSTMVAKSTGEEPSGIPLQSNVLELISKKEHLKAAIKKKGVVEDVAERLSAKGMGVLLQLVKQHA